MKKINTGPFLIMVAAALWALDALIRTDLTQAKIPSASIVMIEHIVGFIILLPFFIMGFKNFKKLNLKDWGLIVLLSFTNSVLATTLFTQALAETAIFGDFVTPILLQKLQPIFVIVLSAIFLREKITLKFLSLVPIALIGSYMISFGTQPINLSFDQKEKAFLLAIGAAFAWGSGTILNKLMTAKLSFGEVTSLRFLFAIPISFVFSIILDQTYNPLNLSGDNFLRFVLIAFTTGAAAILIYYKGLKTTQAKVATMAELTFPIASILLAITALNPYGEAQKLLLANSFGIIILLITILIISIENSENEKNYNKG